MSREKIIKMANQIDDFFQTQPGDAAEGVAKHINDFWDPRMRAELLDLAKSKTSGLHETVQKALPLIRVPASQAG